MTQSDPGLSVACAKCAQPLRYVAVISSIPRIYLYVCRRYGFVEVVTAN